MEAAVTEKPRYRVPAGRRVLPTPPRAGATNLAGGAATGGYEAAQRHRRLFAFRASEQSINSLLMFSGATLRARARFLVRNNPYVKRAAELFVAYLVGNGITLRSKIENVDLRAEVHQAFEEWTVEADADGITDWYGLQALAAAAMYDAGECFIRYRPAKASAGLSVPLQIQLLESEFCPYEFNFLGANGNLVRSGIEFDPNGKRVAYYFWKVHPGDMGLANLETGWVRVLAEEVIHLFRPRRPGQIRGQSEIAAAMVKAYMLDGYDDAELERKKLAAHFTGFITKKSNDEGSPIGAQEQPVLGHTDTSHNADGEVNAVITPGMLQVLEEGEDIRFAEAIEVGSSYEPFEYRNILALCVALGIPYHSVTGDLKQANYSSLRAGRLDLKRCIEQLQRMVMVFQMCRPVFGRWMATAVLSGRFDGSLSASAFNKTPQQYLKARWMAPRWEYVDPSKDVEPEIKAIRAGLQARDWALAERAILVEELDATYAADNERQDELGLVYDTDARKTNLRGSAAPPDIAPPQDPSQDTVDKAEEEAA